jgi:hypothetical protein
LPGPARVAILRWVKPSRRAATPSPPAPRDTVDESSEESFPASDPPSWTGVTGSDGVESPGEAGAKPPKAPSGKPRRPVKRTVAPPRRRGGR